MLPSSNAWEASRHSHLWSVLVSSSDPRNRFTRQGLLCPGGFSRQEYWGHIASSRDLPGIWITACVSTRWIYHHHLNQLKLLYLGLSEVLPRNFELTGIQMYRNFLSDDAPNELLILHLPNRNFSCLIQLYGGNSQLAPVFCKNRIQSRWRLV